MQQFEEDDEYFPSLLGVLAGPDDPPESDGMPTRGARRAARREQKEANVRIALPLNAFVKSRRKRKQRGSQTLQHETPRSAEL